MSFKAGWLIVSWCAVAWLWIITPLPSRADSLDPADSRPAPTPASLLVTYFPEVGHTLTGPFRAYWQSHGGLAQFGFPLTEEFSEQNPTDGQNYTVQYFERERFEYHPELVGTPYEVELGLLGVQQTAGRQFDESAAFASDSRRTYFGQTRHSLGGSFKRYWETQGGLPIYGYPISEEIQEGGLTVQYFERARFEYHPTNPAPYDVLLGLLGTTSLEGQGHHLPQIYRLNYAPDSVVQGRSTAIRLSGSALADRTVRGSLNGVALSFQPLGDQQVAFAGVASDAPLKAQFLRVEVTDDSGVPRQFERSLGVTVGQFDHQIITLDPAVAASVGTPEENQRERARDFGFYNQFTPQQLWTGHFSWPCYGPITTTFGTRRDYTDGGFEIHDGIDIAVADRTPIRAAASGRVVLAELQKARGNIIILDHGLGLHTAYFHQSAMLVKVGDTVNQGDVIGLAGTTGLSTGVHLHWEMRIGSIGVDPTEWVNRSF